MLEAIFFLCLDLIKTLLRKMKLMGQRNFVKNNYEPLDGSIEKVNKITFFHPKGLKNCETFQRCPKKSLKCNNIHATLIKEHVLE